MRILAVSLLLAVGACSSHYMPRHPGRVAVIIRDGQPAYVRDGTTYEHGMLGGGLQEAVAGNAAAEAVASEYHTRMMTGFGAIVVGALGMATGLGMLSYNEFNDPHNANVRTPALVMAAGGVLFTLGAGYSICADPYRWDAINIFNDSEPLGPLPPGASAALQLPGDASATKGSLRMRE
jgi:hypothetical protein